MLGGLEEYHRWLNFAAKKGHPVVEWVDPADDDDDDDE